MRPTVFKLLFFLSVLVVCGIMLAGCGTKIKYVPVPPPPPILTQPTSTLTSPCKAPVNIPERELKQREVEKMWSEDRKSLVTCGSKLKGTVTYYGERDAKIQGSQKNN